MAKKKIMTPLRIKVLRFIETYYAEHQFPPAVREICDGIGQDEGASSVIKAAMDRLVEDGFLKPGIPGAARTIIPTGKKVSIKTIKEVENEFI